MKKVIKKQRSRRQVRLFRVSKVTKLKRKNSQKLQPVKRVALISSAIGVIALAVAIFTGPQTTVNNSAVLSDNTTVAAPLAPTNLAAKVKNSRVTLTWSDASSTTADKYIIFRYDDATGKYVIAPKNQISSVYSKKYVSDENDSGKTYLYKVAGVRLYYEDGKTTPSEAIGAQSDSISVSIAEVKAPVAPKSLRAVVQNSQISFSWKGSAECYKIEFYDSNLKKYILLADGITSTNYSSRQFEPGKTYKFRLSAYNNVRSGGVVSSTLSSLKSATLSVKIPNAKAPTAPAGVKSSVDGEYVRLTWDNPSRYVYSGSVSTDVNYADGYTVMVYSNLSKEWTELGSNRLKYESARVAKISGQNSKETLKYKIKAYKKIYDESSGLLTNLEGPYSNPITVKMP